MACVARGMASVARKTARAARGRASVARKTARATRGMARAGVFTTEYHPQDTCRFSTYSQNQAPSAFRLPTFDCQLKTANLKIFLALDLSVWFVHFKLNVLTLLIDSP